MAVPVLQIALAWHLAMHLVLSIGYAKSRGQMPIDRDDVFARSGASIGNDGKDHAVIVAMGRVDLTTIDSTSSEMFKRALATGFSFAQN